MFEALCAFAFVVAVAVVMGALIAEDQLTPEEKRYRARTRDLFGDQNAKTRVEGWHLWKPNE